MSTEHNPAPQEKRMTQNYEIIDSISVGEIEFVLAVNLKAPSAYATWQCSKGTDYFWGHYFSNELSAKKDLCKRAITEIDFLSREQAPAPKKKEQAR